jgi:hypothetical protein
MAKSNDAARKSQTHFEQVPIEIVKKIAGQEVSSDKQVRPVRTSEPTSRKKKKR